MTARPSPHESLAAFKREGRRIASLTAYDYPTARLLDDAGIDLILVGDSLGMVVLGYEDTTAVTLDEMLHHTRAVRRGTRRALLAADLPYGSYLTIPEAAASACALAGAGADFVKLEGGTPQAPTVQALVEAGIPVIGHIGMLPQHVREEGGYRKKGKTREDADRLLQDALDLETAGASAIVIECTVAEVARAITLAVSVPTIGIGSGRGTDGQILVVHDLIGGFPWFRPGFAPCYAETAMGITAAARRFIEETAAGGA
jgi:3-methyl-2-oxobutanoate hydroxymethyltransferase